MVPRRRLIVYHAANFLSFSDIQMGGGGNTPLVPPPTWFFDIFFNFLPMYLRLCRPLIQLRIHFLRAWGPHDITATSSSRPLIFANLGNYRQNWRFLDLRSPSYLGESAVSKVFKRQIHPKMRVVGGPKNRQFWRYFSRFAKIKGLDELVAVLSWGPQGLRKCILSWVSGLQSLRYIWRKLKKISKNQVGGVL